jgi:mycothiol synthase
MGITYRTFQKTDLPAIVQMANINEERRNDPARTSAEGLQQLVAAPYVKAEEDFSVALTENHELVGASLMMIQLNTGGANADVLVHPDYHDQAVTAELVKRIEARVSQRADTELVDAPAVYITFGVQEYKQYLRDVLENTGYAEVRRGYVMRMALDTPLEPAQFPTGFEFRAFDSARDAKSVHAVFQESFADHWGAVSQIPFEQWEHQMKNPRFDPSLWYVLYHNDEIAAVCLCEPSIREENLGIVEVLGVRPTFRKQGLGGLLLRHSFHEFQKRGFQNVSLDVDAKNTTNAVALYERAGMSVYRCIIAYRKVLRGDPQAIED